MASRKRNPCGTNRHRLRPAFEALEVRRLLASDWQNPGQTWDVNRDLTVSPIDALLGINRLNSNLSRIFPARPTNSTEPYFDVDGSGSHNPLDVLLVINALNRRAPTVAVELLSDSGTGAAAQSDRRTADLSVHGNISMVRATELWGRFESDTQWHDLTTFLGTDQKFTIQHADLVEALGGLPKDGLVTLQFQPRFGVGNAEVGNEVDLPVTLDRTPPQFDFAQRPNFLGVISMPLATAIEVPLNERVSSFTLVVPKIRLFDTTFNSLQGAPQELTPRGVSLSSDGRFLIIDPPTNSASISYLVFVEEGAFEDLAGNLNVAFDTRANYFSNTSQTPLAFAQRIDVSSTQRVVKEFTFDLASPDLFILAGLNATQEVQLDLFSPSGRLVQNWTIETSGGSLGLGSQNWSMLTELGKYTLRVAMPATNEVSFKALLTKQLASVPANLQLQGTFTWTESQAFNLNVTSQDRIYFENNLNPQTPFRVTLLTPYGQAVNSIDLQRGDEVFTVPSAGRYIALIESLTTLRPDSYNYTLHLSQTATQPLTLGQFQQNTLVTPGQQVFYTFAAQAARTYTLEIESEFGDVVIALPGILQNNQAGAFAVEESGDSFVQLAFNRADIPSTLSRFRLVESVTAVTPPQTETIHTEPLQQGVTQRTIQLELESYEFTFAGTAGELFALRDSNPSETHVVRLLASTGSEVQATEQTEAFRVYRIPYSGQYRLRAIASIGTEVAFQWQKLSTATLLAASASMHGNIPLESFAVYRFVANNSRFYVYPLADAVNLSWRLIDDNGHIVANTDFNQTLDIPVTVGRSYTLVVEKQDAFSSEQFDFKRLAPASTARTGTVGTAITGNLTARGARVVVELSLVAGQLLKLTSNLDPTLARVRWLDFTNNESDGPLEIDPSVPVLVGSTRKYHVEIQNLTDAAVAYSIKFDTVQKPLSPPSILVGFDQIHSGNVSTATQTFMFDVTAGSYFMFDWLLAENPILRVEITDPSGNSTSLAAGTDSSLALADVAGVIKVQLTNVDVTDQAFSFRMISPSSGETIALGTKKSASVIPFGNAFFKVPLSNPTEVFLQSTTVADNATFLFRLGSNDPFGTPFEGPFINAQFLAGEAFVWASNLTEAAYETDFTAFNVATLTESPLNTPIILQTVSAVNYLLPFKTTVANTIIGAAGFAVFDQAGTLLETILEGTAYQLKQPGDYRAVIFASGTTTQIELHTQVETNATATLASPISSTIAKVGDVKRYAIALTAGSPILLSQQMSQGGFVRWIAPNGEVVSPPRSGSTVVPVYSTGTYQLELYSGANAAEFLLELNDLSQASAVSRGSHTGNTGAGLIEINRLVATPKQLLELQDASERQVQLTIVDRLGNPLSQVSFANRLFSPLPDDGVAYILVQSLPGDTAVDFTYFVDLVTTQTQAATLGQPISGSLASRLDGRIYTFQVTQPTWLRVASSSTESALLVLHMADGSLRNSSEGFFELMLAGNYEVHIYNDSRSPNAFTLNIDLLNQTPVVPLNQTTTINKSGRYRLDVAATGRFELQLQNSSNGSLSTSELTVTDLHGNEVNFSPRGTLEAGSYWVNFNKASTLPTGDYKLKVASIITSESNLAVGALGEFTLSANGLQEQLVTVHLVPGMRLLIDELELGTSGKVEVRFNSGPLGDWTSVDQLAPILMGATGDETLQFRISGSGLVRLHVIDLNSAAPLTLGASASVALGTRRRGQAWLIDGNIGDVIDFINDSAIDRPAQWMIIDETGQSVGQAVKQPINFAIVNRQRFALVVIATEPLTSTLNVPFHSVVS